MKFSLSMLANRMPPASFSELSLMTNVYEAGVVVVVVCVCLEGVHGTEGEGGGRRGCMVMLLHLNTTTSTLRPSPTRPDHSDLVSTVLYSPCSHVT